MRPETQVQPTRRNLLLMLTALGAGAAPLGALAAQGSAALNAEEIGRLAALLGRAVPDDRAEAVARGLHSTLQRLAHIRELELDDSLEPAVSFDTRASARQRGPA